MCLCQWELSSTTCQRHKGSRTVFSGAINDVTQRDRMLPREAVFMNSCNKLRVHCTSQGVSWLNLVFSKRFSPQALQQKLFCRLTRFSFVFKEKNTRFVNVLCWIRKYWLHLFLNAWLWIIFFSYKQRLTQWNT